MVVCSEYQQTIVIHFFRGVSVALSTDATPEECKFILNDCKASILVVGEPCLLERIKVVNEQ